MNIVILMGNVGADPELRHTQNGGAVLNIRLATKETYLDRDKVKQERTDWHSVVVWGKRAESLAPHISKGSALLVRGKLRTSEYEDREGVKRYKTEVIVDEIEFAGRKPGGASAGRPAAQQGAAKASCGQPADFGDDFGGGLGGGGGDDLPFVDCWNLATLGDNAAGHEVTGMRWRWLT